MAIYGVSRYIYGVRWYIYGVIRYIRVKGDLMQLVSKIFIRYSMAIYGIIRYIYGVIRYIRVKGDLMQLVSKIFIGCNIGIYKKLKLGGKDYDKKVSRFDCCFRFNNILYLSSLDWEIEN